MRMLLLFSDSVMRYSAVSWDDNLRNALITISRVAKKLTPNPPRSQLEAASFQSPKDLRTMPIKIRQRFSDNIPAAIQIDRGGAFFSASQDGHGVLNPKPKSMY